MTEFTFDPCRLSVDVEATRAYYAARPLPWVTCDCAGCRNFERAAAELPAAVRDFFCSLGIDPAKPAEVYVNCTLEDGTVWYGGFYHLCGTVVQG